MRLPSTPVFNFRQDTASVNITTSYSAVLGASDLTTETTMARVNNGTGSSLLLAIGASGSQVSYQQVPANDSFHFPCHLSSKSEMWVKANSATASSGELIITFYY